MIVIEILFWLLCAGLAYVYLGYPLLLYVLARLRPNPVRKSEDAYEPTVTIIIAAHNEEAHLGGTLENKLALEYPHVKVQIIVVSDGSTDATDVVAQQYTAQGILLLHQRPRNGKTMALNMAVRHATGEILVFADANSLYDSSALRHLVSNFADPKVGYVTGKLGYLNPDGSMTGDGCSTYMRYENVIRVYESRIGSLVGVNGGIDAVRRSLYQAMDADDLPDLVLPLRVVAQGSRVVFEPLARLSESAHSNPDAEYRMRVRVSLRALWTLAEMPEILSVRRYGFYAVQVLSHKVLRYLAFFFIAALFVLNLLLWPVGTVYRIALVLQFSFIASALLGFLAERVGKPNRLLSVPYYFMLVNAAALHAFFRFMRGERHRVWSPRLG